MDDLTAPTDPRTSWKIPPPGTLPRVQLLDEATTRVLAPNPSAMTLDGTNTYIVSATGSGEALIVDPGPDDPEHLERVEEAVALLDTEVRCIAVTHHHLDHSLAAADWGRHFDVAVYAASPDVAAPASGGAVEDVVVADGARIPLTGVEVEVVATPGHTLDHVALRLGTGALLTGDHVLGRGTSVVAHPDGDLEAYLESLHRVLELGPDSLFPGHGPELTRDPSAVLRFYAKHREFRQAQILAALAEGPATPRHLVERIYVDVDRGLWGAAESSTRAALGKLGHDGLVRMVDGVAELV